MGEFNIQKSKFIEYTNVGKIPFHMGGGSFLKQNDQIIAVTYNKDTQKISHFNGNKWIYFYSW